MTTKLWLLLLNELDEQYNLQSIPFTLMQQLTKVPKNQTMIFWITGKIQLHYSPMMLSAIILLRLPKLLIIRLLLVWAITHNTQGY